MDNPLNQKNIYPPQKDVSEKFIQEEKFQSILVQEIEKSFADYFDTKWQEDFKGEFSSSLGELETLIMEKIKEKTFNSIKNDLYTNKEMIANNISSQMIDNYREKILFSIKDIMQDKITSLDYKKNIQEDELNIYVGTNPKAPFPNHQLHLSTKGKETCKEISPTLDLQKKDFFYRMFFHSLLFWASALGISFIGVFMFLSPALLLRPSSSLPIVIVGTISTILASLSEFKYFSKRGIIKALYLNRVKFRYFCFFYKILFFMLFFSLLTLVDYSYHTINIDSLPSSLSVYWTTSINKITGLVSKYSSYAQVKISQEVLLGCLLFITFFSLIGNLLKKRAY